MDQSTTCNGAVSKVVIYFSQDCFKAKPLVYEGFCFKLLGFNSHLPLKKTSQTVPGIAQDKIVTNQQSCKSRGNEYRFWAEGSPGFVIGHNSRYKQDIKKEK